MLNIILKIHAIVLLIIYVNASMLSAEANNVTTKILNDEINKSMTSIGINSWIIDWIFGSKNQIIDLTKWDGKNCLRQCIHGAKPRVCYFHFTLEHYHSMGSACGKCSEGVLKDCENTGCIPADGVERGVKSINRQIPGPIINVCQNDLIVIDVANHMTGSSASIHWHGLHQRETPHMDGVPFVTQCPIEYSTEFRYSFAATEPGTQFYHSHAGHHRVDGIFGALIIREPYETDPNAFRYDYDFGEHVILVADWMHELSEMFIPGLPTRPNGIQPDSILINGRGRFTDPKTNITTKTPLEVFRVEHGNSYRFRFINGASHVCPLQLQIENHSMIIIASDSYSLQPQTANTLHSTGGERYDFILNADQKPGEYWIRLTLKGMCSDKNIEQFAVLSYASPFIQNIELSSPKRVPPTYKEQFPGGIYVNHPNATCFQSNDDNKYCIADLKAYTNDLKLEMSQPDYTFTLSFYNHLIDNYLLFQENKYAHFMNIGDDINLIGTINNISLTFPSISLLTQPKDIEENLFCSVNNLPDKCYGSDQCLCIHRLKIKLNSIVEFLIVDETESIGQLNHPFHMHGGSFRVIGMGQHPNGIPMTKSLVERMYLTKSLITKPMAHKSPLKDTVSIPSRGYALVRFFANNPGFWLLHCHFDWHLGVGMGLIIQIGETHEMVKAPDNFPKCGNYLPDVKENDILR